MAKRCSKGSYPNAAPKDIEYGSIVVVSSVASTYGGCWGPCFTMSSHAALGVVRAGVPILKGTLFTIIIYAIYMSNPLDLQGLGCESTAYRPAKSTSA